MPEGIKKETAENTAEKTNRTQNRPKPLKKWVFLSKRKHSATVLC